MAIDFDTTELKKKLAEVDALVNSNTITEERGKVWKNRIVDEFEQSAIPAEVEKKMPSDLSHLPGRMIMGAIDVAKAVARGSGATYEQLSKQYDQDSSMQTGPIRDMKMPPAAKKNKSVLDLYNDLPEYYK